jgi:hypothetical protein
MSLNPNLIINKIYTENIHNPSLEYEPVVPLYIIETSLNRDF